MAQKIYKYKLETSVQTDKVKVTSLPVGQILDYAMQDNEFYVWILIADDKLDLTQRHHYRVIGTGWDIDNLDGYNFCKTIHDPHGFVWHIFRKVV